MVACVTGVGHTGLLLGATTHRHELPVALLERPLQQAAGVLAAVDARHARVQHPHRRRHAQVRAQPCLSQDGDVLTDSSMWHQNSTGR